MWPYQWCTKVVLCLCWFFNHCLGEWSTSPISCHGPCYQCRSIDDWVPVPRECFLVLFNWHSDPSHRTLYSLAKLSLVLSLIQETQVVQHWLPTQAICQMLLCSYSNTAWHLQIIQRNQQSPTSTSLTPVRRVSLKQLPSSLLWSMTRLPTRGYDQPPGQEGAGSTTLAGSFSQAMLISHCSAERLKGFLLHPPKVPS